MWYKCKRYEKVTQNYVTRKLNEVLFQTEDLEEACEYARTNPNCNEIWEYKPYDINGIHKNEPGLLNDLIWKREWED